MDADEQLQAAAAAAESSTEPSPYSDMLLEFSRVVRRHLRHGGRTVPVMQVILRDGIFTWHIINGEPVSDGGAYRDGGFGGVPVSKEAIAALPETTIGDGEGEARKKEAECAVCLEDFQAGDTIRTMPCSHGFHERCILPWLRVSRLCPLCRFALPEAPAETESLADEEEDDHGGDTL